MNDKPLLQDVRRHLAMIHKRRGLVLSCVAVALVAAVIYNYTARPLYQATAQILIDRDTMNVLPTKEILDGHEGSSEYFQTQLELLKGRRLAEKVVDKLNLTKAAELQTGPLMSPWERFQRRFLGRPPASAVDTDGMPLAPTIAAFRSRVTVQSIRSSRLVNLRFNAYDPKLAAQAANALAQTYIEQSLEFRYTTSAEATDWLGDRVAEQKKKLETAEKALLAYRERENLANIEERQSLVDQKLSALTGAAIGARTERINKETLYTQMRSVPLAQLETFPIVRQNGAVQGLRQKLTELEKERGRLAETLGEKHPDMLRVNEEVRSTAERIQFEIQGVIRALETDYRTAAQQEANLVANLEATKQESLDLTRKSIDYNVLKRDVDTNQQLYRELLNRTGEAGLETELRQTNVRIVEKAQVPAAPVSPQKVQNYQIALLVGLALGLGLCLLFEHLDNTFKTPDDLKAHLGLPFLGMVPDVSTQSKNASGPRPVGLHRNPESSVAEAYRVLRTNLLFSSVGETGRAILITSANPTEGKTTTTANLAESLAHNGARVLAVDADLRRPALHQYFGLQKTPGLSDLIVGKSQASQAIQKTSIPGLQVLPCGYVPPNPAELLGSASMREIIKALKEHYDWVLLDSPPTLAIADTSILCPLVDGVILIVGAEIGSRPTVARAVDQIKGVGGRIIGTVLNKVNLERNAYYYSQHYGEYYRSYYAERAASEPAKAAPAQRGARPARRI